MTFLASGAVPQWVSASFPIIRLVLLIIMVLLSIVMIVAVIMQDANQGGMNASGSEDSYFGQKSVGRTFESTMKKVTVWIAVALVVICILFSVTQIVYPASLA